MRHRRQACLRILFEMIVWPIIAQPLQRPLLRVLIKSHLGILPKQLIGVNGFGTLVLGGTTDGVETREVSFK